MSTSDETVSFSLEVNVEKAYEDLRRVQTILYRTLGLFRRMGLPDDVEDGIMRLQRMIAIINSLRLALAALQAARMAAGDPLAWAMAGVSVATTVASVADFSMELG